MQNEIRYFSMFTGVGGFELGFERASHNQQSDICKESQQAECKQGRQWDIDKPREMLCPAADTAFRCVGFSEIYKYCRQLLAQKYPDIPNFGDCTKINPAELPEFDMLCGGFPCQSFSIAGKRRGFDDTRGTMFFEVARILEAKRPRLVLLENVKGLLNHDKGQTFKVIIQTLWELGYDVQWMVLNSKFFGVPQNRERVFIIGNIRGEPRPEILPFGYSSTETYPDIKRTQSDVSGKGYSSQEDRCYRSDGIMGTLPNSHPDNKINIIVACAYRTRTYCNQPGSIEMRNDEIANQLTTVQKDSMVINRMRIRRLTPIECERLQGFPDNWTEGFSDTQRYKMMGNAVTVNVIEAIASKLLFPLVSPSGEKSNPEVSAAEKEVSG